MAERPRELIGLRRVGAADIRLLLDLFAALPDRDRSFLDRRLDSAEVGRWADEPDASHWLAGTAEEAHAYLSVVPHGGWSSHVGDLRLAVAAAHRRRGIGRALARHGLLQGVQMGLTKITVEVAAESEGDIAMFTSIGFRPEALLEDHIRDSTGTLHDLVLLSHDVRQVREDLEALGVDDALGLSDRG